MHQHIEYTRMAILCRIKYKHLSWSRYEMSNLLIYAPSEYIKANNNKVKWQTKINKKG
jgi:hypothetical protein